MTFDSSNFLLKDFVPETRLKFTLTKRSRCDTHGVLTTAQEDLNQGIGSEGGRWDNGMTDIWLVWCERCAVERGFSRKRLDDHQCSSVVDLKTWGQLSRLPL